MKHTYLFLSKFLVALVVFASFSCEIADEEEIEDSPLTITTNESPCTDEEITTYLTRDCIAYFGVYQGDAASENMKLDFSEESFIVYNNEDEIVDEGTWSITDGVVIFGSLTSSFERFTGEWNVIECRESFVKLEQGEEQIGFEFDCTVVEEVTEVAACTDEEITTYLTRDCIAYFGVYQGDAASENMKLDFSEESFIVYNNEDEIVDEGTWSITDGVVTFGSLTNSFERFTGEWNVIECRESFVKLEKEEEQIGFEFDCTVVEDVTEVAACTDEEIVSLLINDCLWQGHYSVNDSLTGLKHSFLNDSFTVYDNDNLVVDEGTWVVADGVITFDSLSGSFEAFTGEWKVVECREKFLRIENEAGNIGFETDCS